MRLGWHSAIAPVLVVFVGGYCLTMAIQGNTKAKSDPGNGQYLRQIHAAKSELADVGKNLHAFSEGKPMKETPHHVLNDAKKEAAELGRVTLIPTDIRTVHQSLLGWAELLKNCATLADSNPNKNLIQVKTQMARADQMYQHIEQTIASIER